jgi:signal transduction histidine kinase
LCVIGMSPRKWSLVDLDRLSDLAGAVMREIELRELARTLKDTFVAHEVEEVQHRARLRSMFDELRSPMATVSSCTEQLAGSAGDFKPWQVDLVQRCKHSARELMRATRAIEAGELAEGEGIGPLERQTVSVSLLVRRAIRTMQPLADDADVLLDLKSPGDLLFLHADPGKIERVLVVLLTNAIQCSAPGDLVTTEIERVERSGCPTCLITVSDQCATVPDAEKRQMFYRFVQRPSLNARGGLMFCRKVLEAHGGEIGVTDVPDGGSSFYCYLPLARMPVE